MILKEDIKPVTYLKSNAAGILEFINQTHRPVVITQNGKAKAVLQDPESYDKNQQALALLKMISQSERQLQEGGGVGQDRVFERVAEALREKTKV